MGKDVHPTSGFSPVEELWNSLTHGFGIPIALVGWVVLVYFSLHFGDPLMLVACSVYGLSLVLLYSASTLYHSMRSLRWKKAFLIFDHCCIYLLIAGSYTPFALGPLRGPLGLSVLAVIWFMAIIGVVRECLQARRGGVLSAVIYLIMGWLSLAIIVPLYMELPRPGFFALIAGGVLYSLGVVFYLSRKLKFHHAIWHLFVLGGSICQFFAVLSIFAGNH